MFLRRIFGIEVSRSFDVSEDGIEGTLTNRNPDDHNWLQKVEQERRERHQHILTTSQKKRSRFGSRMATVSLTTDEGEYAEIATVGAEGEYSEIAKVGADNPGFDASVGEVLPEASVEIPSLPSASAEDAGKDENDNFYANLFVGGPGALDPAVKPEGSLDPGVAHSNEDADDVDDDFPSENFWAGCRNIDLKDWVESVKTQPPDKIMPSVVNSTLPEDYRLNTTDPYVDIVDPVIQDGRVKVQPPPGTFSYIKTDQRVPEEGEPAVDCFSDPLKYCYTKLDKGGLDNWYWLGLVVVLVTVIIIVAIVVGVRGADNVADSDSG